MKQKFAFLLLCFASLQGSVSNEYEEASFYEEEEYTEYFDDNEMEEEELSLEMF